MMSLEQAIESLLFVALLPAMWLFGWFVARWLVLDPSERILGQRADLWEAQGDARTVERFGTLRVVHVFPRRVPH